MAHHIRNECNKYVHAEDLEKLNDTVTLVCVDKSVYNISSWLVSIKNNNSKNDRGFVDPRYVGKNIEESSKIEVADYDPKNLNLLSFYHDIL